jgi:hypothetical protein
MAVAAALSTCPRGRSVIASTDRCSVLNTAVTPPVTRCAIPPKSSFWVWPGWAEMEPKVDHAGQDVQALAVDHPPAVACPSLPIAAIRPLVTLMSRMPSWGPD